MSRPGPALDMNPRVLKCPGRLAFICRGWCDADGLDNSTVPSLLFAVSDAIGLVCLMLVSKGYTPGFAERGGGGEGAGPEP